MNTIYDSSLLLVDDNEDLCRMLTDMLCREGFRNVEAAGSCAEAFLHFQMGKKEPDLVILDINLPDGDGFSLMQRIRMVSMVPVLFLSARDEDNDRLLGLGLGADDYMTKPFLPKELILRVTAGSLLFFPAASGYELSAYFHIHNTHLPKRYYKGCQK